MSSAKGKRHTYERDVEAYLKARVEANGGRCDLLAPRGTKGLPDCLVTWPRAGWAQLHLIEVKAPTGSVDPWQERDHAARKALGCHVRVIWSKEDVDRYIEEYGARARPLAETETLEIPRFPRRGND